MKIIVKNKSFYSDANANRFELTPISAREPLSGKKQSTHWRLFTPLAYTAVVQFVWLVIPTRVRPSFVQFLRPAGPDLSNTTHIQTHNSYKLEPWTDLISSYDCGNRFGLSPGPFLSRPCAWQLVLQAVEFIHSHVLVLVEDTWRRENDRCISIKPVGREIKSPS